MMTIKLDFKVRCSECGNEEVYARFHEEQVRTVTSLVIVVEPCDTCKQEKYTQGWNDRDEEEKGEV